VIFPKGIFNGYSPASNGRAEILKLKDITFIKNPIKFRSGVWPKFVSNNSHVQQNHHICINQAPASVRRNGDAFYAGLFPEITSLPFK
jgi:hypothetical protein